MITDLRGLGGGFGDALAINARGQVIGTSVPAGGYIVHAFLWQNGKITNLGTLGRRASSESDTPAINDHDQIVGVSNTAGGSCSQPAPRTTEVKGTGVIWGTRLRLSYFGVIALAK